ncbi:signal peptide peptidase SppA [Kovacikia minuta CCNUW1]|uniref:signal peptide peptidase SppA n=1 Tax=Kovacikia minuta TaxID=2931930 RepID=UPI001CCC385D|nr:signal peptide peptidase SppA [Kovacikia minuta]UBF26111.1 signal peptide peptidase SppA [Kovacikia minuta CCNUW1]
MRDFLKYTFATVLGLLIFLGLSIGGLVSLVIMAVSSDTGPQVKDKSVLTFNLSLNITDSKRGSSPLAEALVSRDEPDTITLRSVLDAIDKASRDPRIVGLYLYGDTEGGGTGFATLKEVREALQRFRASGKKIVAYDVNWREREYYLASVADTIALNPIGSLELNGLSSEMMFLAGALKKYGIGIQVTRVGKYKSAVEPLLLTKPSPANRQQTEALLGDLWKEFLTETGKNRNLTAPRLQTIADNQGVLMADEALKSRLIDRVAYLDEVVTDLKKLTDSKEKDKSFRQISLKSYARVAEDALEKERNSTNKIAVVYAEGEIVNGEGGDGEVGGDRLAKQLRQIRQNKTIKAVVLRVNSPGGSVTASEVIQREVILTRKEKPLVVSMGSVAASGGYWISTYSDRIFAEPNTITGSIGVFGVLPNIQKLANNNGITWDVVKTGRFADTFTISRPKTPQEIALIQRSVDIFYNEFLTKVSESRKLAKPKVAEIAQGRVWSGQRAKAIGLVDELGGMDAAIQDAAKRAKLGDDWELEEYPKARSFEERLFGKLVGDQVFSKSSQVNPLTTEFKKLQVDLKTLQLMNDPLGVYARLPFNFRID